MQRTRMYNDNVRWWYEAYFLTRRTTFILLSVLFDGNDVLRSVRSSRAALRLVVVLHSRLLFAHSSQQITFMFTLFILLVQCRLMPYRIPAANFREIVMLSCLCLASGYELLRVFPVNQSGMMGVMAPHGYTCYVCVCVCVSRLHHRGDCSAAVHDPRHYGVPHHRVGNGVDRPARGGHLQEEGWGTSAGCGCDDEQTSCGQNYRVTPLAV